MPKFEGKYDINLTVNIMQNNNTNMGGGSQNEVSERSIIGDIVSGKEEEKKSESLGNP